MNATAHDPDAGVEPAYAAPAQACDAHFHVFGAKERYPYGTDIRYEPPYEPLETYLMPALRDLPVEFTVAHFGLFPANDGVGQHGFQELLSLAGDGSRRCWVKLTGTYRFSTAPGFADVAPFAQALIATAPQQLIWGSD